MKLTARSLSTSCFMTFWPLDGNVSIVVVLIYDLSEGLNYFCAIVGEMLGIAVWDHGKISKNSYKSDKNKLISS